MKKIIPTLVFIVVLLSGIGFLLYPYISDFISRQNRQLEILEYDRSVENLEEQQIALAWEQAKAYNEESDHWSVGDVYSGANSEILPEDYLAVLNISEMMGYIEIPKIKVNLPIKHGTSDHVLENSVGHLTLSDLPIGGESNHAVLTGHTGLPSAILFTNLDKLEIGDYFFLNILDEKLAYKVDSMTVVLPSEIDSLKKVDGEDYVTLITCTPYGINSHRLLVKGTRTELPSTEQLIPSETVPQKSHIHYILPLLLFLMGVILLIIGIGLRKRNKGRKRK